jgi:signal transduction histidine kinase
MSDESGEPNSVSRERMMGSARSSAESESSFIAAVNKHNPGHARSAASHDSDVSHRDALDELLAIQEYERKRLGQELHDAAGQLLTSLQFSIGRLRAVSKQFEQANLVEEISNIVGQIDQEIRSLTFLNYPAELGESGLCRTVQSLTLGFGRRTGIHSTFKCVGDPSTVNEAISLSLLRVAQEALTNVFRHSHASNAKVVLERRPNQLHLTVSDDGVGIAAEANSELRGVGLTGMRHRIESLGGRFMVRKVKDGTRVSASVPVSEIA